MLRPIQGGSCTHIIANGGLSGTKTQKWINGQGARGLAKRMKVVTTDCEYSITILVLSRKSRYLRLILIIGILDSVENGKRVSEAGYGVIQDPVSHFRIEFTLVVELMDESQNNLFTAFGTRPKVERKNGGVAGEENIVVLS
jgi:hypothetical protein